MRRAFVGAALVVAGIAAFIVANDNAPIARLECPGGGPNCSEDQWVFVAHGMSRTAYDLLRIGGWALVIFGAVLVVLGLIGYWGAQRDARA